VHPCALCAGLEYVLCIDTYKQTSEVITIKMKQTHHVTFCSVVLMDIRIPSMIGYTCYIDEMLDVKSVILIISTIYMP